MRGVHPRTTVSFTKGRGERILEGGGVMIRVLIVLDGGFFGVHARSLLRRQPDVEVVDLLPLDNELVAKAIVVQPNVIVIDTEFMVSQVLPTANDLRARLPQTAVLVLCDPNKRGML